MITAHSPYLSQWGDHSGEKVWTGKSDCVETVECIWVKLSSLEMCVQHSEGDECRDKIQRNVYRDHMVMNARAK